MLVRYLFTIVFIGFCFLSTKAQTEGKGSVDVFDMSLEQLLNIKVEEQKFHLYGYINSNVEKVFNLPTYDTTGQMFLVDQPITWTPVRNFHIYGSQRLTKKVAIFFNLAYNGGNGIEVRNAYGDFEIHPLLQVRVGKMYRRFGLYNEKLDQVPTFIGIEAPEIFDQDHLFLTRTTAFMLHGEMKATKGSYVYALTFDNGEGGPHLGNVPLGWDFRYRSEEYHLIIGTSGYTSGGKASSTVGFGDGSPRGAVLPWMESDRFQVYTFFIEKTFGRILLQACYTYSPHNAIRNRSNTLRLINEAGINDAQRERFLGQNASKADQDLTEADVVTDVSYLSQSGYVRFGYGIPTKLGQFIPYFLFDYMQNQETVANLKYGGDNEAGLSDNGVFVKPSVGVAYRPQPEVAIKLDASMHSQTIDNKRVNYPEIRLDFSFTFDAIKSIKKATNL